MVLCMINAVRRFNGIFFGDFTAGYFRGIVGPLAVQGNFDAPNYNINTLLPVNCNGATNSLDSYGFVLGGNTNSFSTQVYGSVYIGGKNSSLEEITELQPGCIVTENQGTGLFNFETFRANREEASRDLAKLAPTQMFDVNGKTTQVQADENPNYEAFEFNTCETGSCGEYPKYASNSNSIFFGQGAWKGLQDAKFDTNKTIVLNIPVTDGATLTLTTDSPSAGFYTCKLIYNFYPVDEYSHFKGDGTFTLIRETKGAAGGYILAPRAKIFDGATGHFAAYAKHEGDVVDASIYWYVGPSSCTEFNGCIPIHDDSTPYYLIPLPEPPVVTRARMQTFFETRDIETTRTVSYPAYVTRTVESFASSNKPVFSCDPTNTIVSAGGSVKQITVPGSTVVVGLRTGGDVTTVVVKETTIEVVPDVHVVTKTDTLVSHATDTVQESCPPNQNPDHWYPHGHDHDWVYDWDHDEDKWHKDQIDHSNHHHGPDKECHEFDRTVNQYQKKW
ncbi:hypothetical protein HPULCUR_002541 [Helicostylum pulchrum]|uniref:Choice-of-anchor A domain-containing protein n=1 Tax=Helicostylum pulchrum TaxID=562976 RepID=A0ABP9XQW1_9FUNG